MQIEILFDQMTFHKNRDIYSLDYKSQKQITADLCDRICLKIQDINANIIFSNLCNKLAIVFVFVTSHHHIKL